MNWSAFFAAIAAALSGKPSAAPAAPAVTATPAPSQTAAQAQGAAASGPTGAQVASAISAVTPALTMIAAAMASPTFKTAVVVSEDIEQILADFGVPGAAIAEQIEETAVAVGPTFIADAQIGWPILAPLVSAWLASAPGSAGINLTGYGAGGRNYGR